jgi:hypothetical protein
MAKHSGIKAITFSTEKPTKKAKPTCVKTSYQKDRRHGEQTPQTKTEKTVSDPVVSKPSPIMKTKKEEIVYGGKTRQELIDAIIDANMEQTDLDLLADILENGHIGYSSYGNEELIEAYLSFVQDEDDEEDEYDE